MRLFETDEAKEIRFKKYTFEVLKASNVIVKIRTRIKNSYSSLIGRVNDDFDYPFC